MKSVFSALRYDAALGGSGDRFGAVKAVAKHFRHIATRYDRRAIYFPACIHLASAMIWMR
jgi:hypothetical protein